MAFLQADLAWAVNQGLISRDQAKALIAAQDRRGADRPRFEAAHVLYYFGALLVMGAMGWFMTEAWENLGGGGIALVAGLYAALFVLAGRHLWQRERLHIPGGLLITAAVWMTPLVVYGLERLAGVWPQGDPGAFHGYHFWIKGSWVAMELATVVSGLLALRRFRFPFLTFPIAYAFWYLSMDLAPLLVGRDLTWDDRKWVSIGFGLIVLVLAFETDRRTDEDYAFWGYLFGLLTFWGGLTLLNSDSELNRFLYGAINIGLMAASVLLERRVFMVFGAMGVFGYLGHLAFRVFRHSALFPVALTLLGLLIIYFGVKYQRHHAAIERFFHDHVPPRLRALLPRARAAV